MINCNIIYNTPCLKCQKIEPKMVIIGALCMCQKCFESEFNTEEIDPKSEVGKKYYKWLNVLREQVGLRVLGVKKKGCFYKEKDTAR